MDANVFSEQINQIERAYNLDVLKFTNSVLRPTKLR